MKKLSETFDVAPIDPVSIPKIEPQETEPKADAELARANIKSLIQVGNQALEHALNVAIQSESPRAFEVFSTLMKNISDMNAQLLDTHITEKKAKESTGSLESSGPQQVTNNNVTFIGTTADLNRIIKERMANVIENGAERS